MFDKDSLLSDILKTAGTEPILHKYNLPCLHCPMAAQELGVLTLGQVCEMYELDLKGLLADLNELK
ncbi:hypothetical protein HY932_00855 [Candidatus Falkowbacteria bacterium]|nr:hypothetical protein [Candidatus Falkowbacteria bacterium]